MQLVETNGIDMRRVAMAGVRAVWMLQAAELGDGLLGSSGGVEVCLIRLESGEKEVLGSQPIVLQRSV